MAEFSRYELYMILNQSKPLWLCKIDLSGAELRGLNLEGASLISADLSKTNLTGANLAGANATDYKLSRAKSLTGTILPDGSVHE